MMKRFKNLTRDDSSGNEVETDIPTSLGVLNRMVFRVFLGYLVVMFLFIFVGFIFAYLQMHTII